MTRIRALCAAALVVSVLLAAGALLLARHLGIDAGPRTLAPGGSDSAAATTEYAQQFGGDPVVILIRGPWKTATDTRNIVTLAALEGEVRKVDGVKLVEGPGGLVYTAANAALGPALQQLRADATAAGNAARKAALEAGKSSADADAAARAAEVDTLQRETAALLEKYPAIKETGIPGLDNPRFVSAFLFRADGSVKPLFRPLFPRPDASLVVVRLAEGASLTTVRDVRNTVSSLLRKYPLSGVSVTVSGAPVVSEGLVSATVTDLRVVVPVAAVAMLVILMLLLPGWLGLLPLPVAALAVAYTYGSLDLLRRPTTLAAIAAIPILLGLVTDYAVQLAAGRGDSEQRFTPRTLGSRLRALWLAAAATAAGALALLVSPIPVVGSLGTVVAIGVACGMLALLLAGAPVLLLAGNAARGTRERLQAAAGRIGGFGLRHRGAVLVVAAVAGVAGLALSPLQRTTTDLRDFVSPGLPALHDLDTLESATGAGGEVDVLVDSTANVASPQVVAWMLGAERRLRALLPAGSPPPVSLADLLVTVHSGTPPNAADTNVILQTLPAYILQGLVTRDAAHAGIAMSIPLRPLDEQESLFGRMRAALQPPQGITARLAGTSVLAADGERGLAGSALLVDLLALGAVALVLLVTTLNGWRVLVALVPMALATGWTTLVVVALRIQVTPISAVLGALVVALATEFSVIWSTRFREARRDGRGAEEAAAVTSTRTGSAIAVSGLTLCAGFLALTAGSSPLLRSFGLVAGCGVVAAVAAVLLLCPPLCARLIQVEPAPIPAAEPEPAAETDPPQRWAGARCRPQRPTPMADAERAAAPALPTPEQLRWVLVVYGTACFIPACLLLTLLTAGGRRMVSTFLDIYLVPPNPIPIAIGYGLGYLIVQYLVRNRHPSFFQSQVFAGCVLLGMFVAGALGKVIFTYGPLSSASGTVVAAVVIPLKFALGGATGAAFYPFMARRRISSKYYSPTPIPPKYASPAAPAKPDTARAAPAKSRTTTNAKRRR